MIGLRRLPPNRAQVLTNCTCPYCGCELHTGNITKEHVVGRNVVPRGTLQSRWNLILSACQACNNVKSKLEDDISAISLQPNARGEYARSEPAILAESARKAAGSRSRATGKTVAESVERLQLTGLWGPGVRITAGLIAPPRIDTDRVFALARMQLAAFFYYVTYSHESRQGGFWIGNFSPLVHLPRSDWGNDVLRRFGDLVVGWEPRFIGGTAQGMFKIVIRRAPDSACWSWALEWNESIRVVGFFGEPVQIEQMTLALPSMDAHWLDGEDGSRIAIRSERALAPEDDRVFFWDDGCSPDNQ